jgi:DNA sulfur modification protein DndB
MNLTVLKGHFGDFTYYLGKLPAHEFIKIARRPKKDDDWNEEDLNQYQRELNEKRVLTEIIPYLTNNSDRFFPPITLIPTVNIIFQPHTKDLGSIEFPTEKEPFITLDGMHRHYALDRLHSENDTSRGLFASQVKFDDVSFVIIDVKIEDRTRIRRLFTKLNKHAKPTSKSENIIIDEDDPAAVVTRDLIRSRELFFSGNDRLVELMNKTINKTSNTITNQATLYNSVKYIAKTFKADTDSRRVSVPADEDKVSKLFELSKLYWKSMLQEIHAYTLIKKNPGVSADLKRKSSNNCLLFEPAGQEIIIESLNLAVKNLKFKLDDLDDEKLGQVKIVIRNILPKYNKLNWSRSNESAFINYILSREFRITRQRDDVKKSAELLYYIANNGNIDFKIKKNVEDYYFSVHSNKSGPLSLLS